MIKIVTVVGARPQIIKAAALSRTIKSRFFNEIEEFIVHTGQHYDANMSQVFFEELGIPSPNLNLSIGSGPHGKQTALMIHGIEDVLVAEKPNYIVLYGDTNSTLAGAIAASKMRIPIVHIEAGLRSFNKSMPEEINRIMCDHSSTLLFVPTLAGISNLEKEGFNLSTTAPFTIDNPGVFHCGDIMFDNLIYFSNIADESCNIVESLGLKNQSFVLCTIHRDNNTDDPKRLNSIFRSLQKITVDNIMNVVIPLHPRTSNLLQSKLEPGLYEKIFSNSLMHLIPPVSYLEMIALEKNSRLVITDSGGVQKEAYFFKKPLVVARPETEWVEIIQNGAGVIADADESHLVDSVRSLLYDNTLSFPPVFGDGNAAEFICNKLLENS